MTTTLETMIAGAVAKRMEDEREAREQTAREEQARRERLLDAFKAKLAQDLGKTFLETTQGDWYVDGNTCVPRYMFYYCHHIVSLEYNTEALNSRLQIVTEDTQDEHKDPRRGFVLSSPHETMLENTLLKIHELTSGE